ncbi:MAG: hypothetical protein BWY92_01141 [Firmicutes bacterium ADurb.BinA052]|nr:MAG: hypothetical protein BWY92_01141 [Firmicutes bacterium ADurb.BinA052]
MKPPRNIAAIDAPLATPYTTIVRLGGITTPRPPAPATSDAVKPLPYPLRTISGSTIDPTAATVATPDPETAPKKQLAATETAASPPVMCPISALASFIRRGVLPLSIRLPASMNSGRANRGNESMPITIR